MEKIFEGKSCMAEYNAAKQRIRYSFDGYADVDEHKKMYQKAMEYLKDHKTTTFLYDFRNMKGTFTMLNDFAIEFFRPAVELGLEKSAMVLNEDILTSFAANDALTKIKLIEVNVFKDVGEAEAWCDV